MWRGMEAWVCGKADRQTDKMYVAFLKGHDWWRQLNIEFSPLIQTALVHTRPCLIFLHMESMANGWMGNGWYLDGLSLWWAVVLHTVFLPLSFSFSDSRVDVGKNIAMVPRPLDHWDPKKARSISFLNPKSLWVCLWRRHVVLFYSLPCTIVWRCKIYPTTFIYM